MLLKYDNILFGGNFPRWPPNKATYFYILFTVSLIPCRDVGHMFVAFGSYIEYVNPVNNIQYYFNTGWGFAKRQ